jgi:acyl-CoA dehydrogenase
MNAPSRFPGEHGAAPQEGAPVNRPDPMIADLAQRIFSDHEDAPGLPPAEPMNRALWSALAASGLLSLTASPGLEGLVNAAEVAREAGRTAARVPLVETMAAAWVQACCGWPFEDPAEGPVALAFSHAAPEPGAATAVLSLQGVAHVRGAAAVLVIGADEAWLCATADAEIVGSDNLADEPRASLRCNAARVLARGRIDGGAVRALAAILRTAAMAGAAERTLAIALEHARTRQQFGRPIGGFQAVQQMLAQLAGQTAIVSAAADAAASRFPRTRDPLLAAAAKAAAGEAVSPIAALSHQIVAAMGYTREHALHRYTRRLWSWRDEDGSDLAWQQYLGERLLASGDGLWPFVTALMGDSARD